MVLSETRSQTTPGKVFIACGAVSPSDEEQFCPAVMQIINELAAQNYHVTAGVENIGRLTFWLSSRRTYYYLTPTRRESTTLVAQLPEKGYRRYVGELSSFFSQTRFNAVVIAGYSPCTIASLLAATIARVPVFTLKSSADSSYLAEDGKVKTIHRALKKLEVWADADAISHQVRNGFAPSAKKRFNAALAAIRLSWYYAAHGRRNAYLCIKRLFDVASALTLLLSTGLTTLCLLISRSHRVTKSTVMGKNNKPFTLYTLRSTHAPESQSRLWWLPTMLNLLRGDVSLVGPRIVTAEEHSRQAGRAMFYWIAPGLAAWSRLRAGEDDDEEHLTSMDNLYVATINPLLDIKIAILSLLRVFKLLPKKVNKQ